MRDPDNLYNLYDIGQEPPSIISMDNVPIYNIPDWDFNDEKEVSRYIQTLERSVIRKSYEYRTMINYLRECIDMNKCSFYENVNNIDNTRIQIEIHHEPLSLYDICIIVFNKRKELGESLDEEFVAKEVMYLHYDLMVGLIPLATTVHELVHGNYLFVPTSAVYGKYREFVDRYRPWMLQQQLDTLERIENTSQDYKQYANTFLSKHYIYTDMTGSYDLPRTEDVINMVKDRIGSILNQSDIIMS